MRRHGRLIKIDISSRKLFSNNVPIQFRLQMNRSCMVGHLGSKITMQSPNPSMFSPLIFPAKIWKGGCSIFRPAACPELARNLLASISATEVLDRSSDLKWCIKLNRYANTTSYANMGTCHWIDLDLIVVLSAA